MPTFAKVRGSSTTIREKQQVEKKTIKTELTDYYNSIQSLRIKHNELSSNLLQLVSKFISRALLGNINNSLWSVNSSITVMNKINYDRKVKELINERIEHEKYEETKDNILKRIRIYPVIFLWPF